MSKKKADTEKKSPQKNQQTLEKWFAPVKKKADSQADKEEEIHPSKMQTQQPAKEPTPTPQVRCAQTRKQSAQKAQKKEQTDRAKRAVKKAPKIEQPEPKPQSKPIVPKQKSSKKAAKKSETPSEKADVMEVEEPEKQAGWMINDPAYAFLFHEEVLSDTEYIFDKNDLESLARYRKVSETNEEPEAPKRAEDRTTRAGEQSKQSKKKTGKEGQQSKRSLSKDKSNAVHSEDPA